MNKWKQFSVCVYVYIYYFSVNYNYKLLLVISWITITKLSLVYKYITMMYDNKYTRTSKIYVCLQNTSKKKYYLEIMYGF